MKRLRIIIIIAILLGLAIFFILNFSTEVVENVDNGTIIQPEEEISDEQMRQTVINLYFEDKQSLELVKEEMKIDVKELIDTPYLYIVNLLLQGPKSEGLQSAIPEGTKVNKVEVIGDTANVDLSKEFLNCSGTNAIYSVVNSLTEFKDINSVKILIDGEENSNFKDAFVRKE